MCFTPRVSFATALVQFLAAIYVWLTLKRNMAMKLLVLFLYLLGLYQFSEFMICMSEFANIWSRIGFISYNFLPVLSLHIVLIYCRVKFPRFLLYIVPVVAALYAVFMQGFIFESACHEFFVTIKTPFFKDVGSFPWIQIYFSYYFGFILLSVLILMKRYFDELRESKKRVFLGMMIALLISLVPAYVFIVLLPSQGVKFPSVYCQFAIMFALFAVYAAHKDPDFLS